MEILDTRGIAESEDLDDELSAETALINDIHLIGENPTLFEEECKKYEKN